MLKQLTFPHPMTVTLNGEKVRFGAYEACMIIGENGYRLEPTVKLSSATIWVTEVELADGQIMIFDEPFYKTNVGFAKPRT